MLCENILIRLFRILYQFLPEDGQHKILIKADYNKHRADGFGFSVREMYINICNYWDYIRVSKHALLIKSCDAIPTFPSCYFAANSDQVKKLGPGGECGMNAAAGRQTSFPSPTKSEPGISAGFWPC